MRPEILFSLFAPVTSLPGLIVSSLSLSFMFYLWSAKRRAATALDQVVPSLTVDRVRSVAAEQLILERRAADCVRARAAVGGVSGPPQENCS